MYNKVCVKLYTYTPRRTKRMRINPLACDIFANFTDFNNIFTNRLKNINGNATIENYTKLQI